MTDRELLEKAARAGGYTLNGHTQDERKFCVGGAEWNPITDDGDALRLAVRLDVRFFYDVGTNEVVCDWFDGLRNCQLAHYVGAADKTAATRRAIVRAAAAMADAKEGGA